MCTASVEIYALSVFHGFKSMSHCQAGQHKLATNPDLEHTEDPANFKSKHRVQFSYPLPTSPAYLLFVNWPAALLVDIDCVQEIDTANQSMPASYLNCLKGKMWYIQFISGIHSCLHLCLEFFFFTFSSKRNGILRFDCTLFP